MAENGQAQANAALMIKMQADCPLPRGASLLLIGVGTGQFLDYVDGTALAPFRLTCTDINAKFLDAFRARLRKMPPVSATLRIDDLEETALEGPFDAATAILVLEHIDWKKGVSSLVKLSPTWLHLILQRNESAPKMLWAARELAPSIREFGKIARPTLVPEAELTSFLAEAKYGLHRRYEQPVPDNKTMIGLTYRRP